MKTEIFKIGQEIKYTKGGPAVYTGKIVKVKESMRTLIVINCDAGMELWNAGFAVGDEI